MMSIFATYSGLTSKSSLNVKSSRDATFDHNRSWIDGLMYGSNTLVEFVVIFSRGRFYLIKLSLLNRYILEIGVHELSKCRKINQN